MYSGSIKKLVLGLAFVSVFKTAYCQPSDYMPYYKEVNQAELQLADGKFDDALGVYKVLFQRYKPLSKDLYNASLCAVLSKDYLFAVSSAKECMRQGYSKSKFQCRTYDSLPNPYRKLLLSSYDSLNTVYRVAVDSSYYRALDSIDNQEITLLKKTFGTKDYGYGSGNGNYAVFYAHAKFLKEYIEKHGLPRLASFSGHILPYSVILHHFGFMNSVRQDSIIPMAEKQEVESYSLRHLLFDAVMRGEYPPQDYYLCLTYLHSDLYTNLNTTEFYTIDLDKRCVVGTTNLLPKAKATKINEFRALVGLESLDDLKKKCKESAMLKYFPYDKAKSYFLSIGMYEDNAATMSATSQEILDRASAIGEFIHDAYIQAKVNDFVLPSDPGVRMMVLPPKRAQINNHFR